MSAKDLDISHVTFTSTAFPTKADMALWHSLSSEEKKAVVLRDVEEGLNGKAATNASREALTAKVLAQYAHAL